MAQMVANCPRCGSLQTTFDVLAHTFVGRQYVSRSIYQGDIDAVEVFARCRACTHGTIFKMSTKVQVFDARKNRLAALDISIDLVSENCGYISLKDKNPKKAPEHLPPEIEAAFNEGATCMAVGCYNAEGTMFRLCVDMVTVGLLPAATTPSPPGPNHRERRDLGLRLKWLFDNAMLPEALHELAKCVQEDGNDSAHRGTLTKDDSEDLLDFTEALLERIYTEPKRIELAQLRRVARRAPS